MDGKSNYTVAEKSSSSSGGVPRSGGVVYHPKPWQRVARVTSNSTAVIAKEYDQR